MANVTTELKVVVRSVGKGEIDKLSKALNDLGSKAVEPVNQTLKNSVGELKKLSSQSKLTRNNVRGFSAAFKEVANNLEIGSKEFREATAEAAKLDKQLASLEKRQPTRGQRLRGAARTAGAVAAGGVFGGPEGAIGAGIGGIAGGPAGAAVGAAIGAQVGQFRQAAGATAEYAAGLDKLRIALEGVTTSQQEYSRGLEFIEQTTKDFAIPQEVVTRQFTKLQASVQGAGGNLEDTKTAFNGIVAAVRATGGSLADVDAALTATAQVFSKGKVSAEELRQQIGERLPGAFTLFAESMALTPQELDKALEDGKVSLQDFQKFAEAIFARYGENAKAIADAPQSAGDRLAVALERLNEVVGNLLQPIGAKFQQTFAGIAEAITKAVAALDNFFGISDQARQNALITQVNALNQNIARTKRLAEGFQAEIEKDGDFLGQRQNQVDKANLLIAEFERKREKLRVELNALTSGQAVSVQQPTAGTGLPGIIPDAGKPDAGKDEATLDKTKRTSQELLDLAIARNEALQVGDRIRVAQLDFAIKIQQITERFNAGEIDFNTAKKLDLDAQNKLIETGLRLRKQEKKDLADLSREQKEVNKDLTETEKFYQEIGTTIKQGFGSAIESLIFQTKSLGESLGDLATSLAKMFLQFGVQSAFGALGAGGGFLGQLFGSAKGNVFAENKIVPFAYGGVVDKPTIFPMANGMGLMGEAGPEAIMPLRRGPGGRLGVEAAGGVGNVVVNVDASGSSVQGDQPNAKALGSAIGAAVQAELIKQKRPGGLLS